MCVNIKVEEDLGKSTEIKKAFPDLVKNMKFRMFLKKQQEKEMKINLVNLVQNKIYKNPINKEKSAQTAPSKSNFPPAKS